MTNEPLSIPQQQGKVTRQAHVDVPSGTYEEEYARNGFSGRYAHLYRSEPPVNWVNIEGPLRPRAYDLLQSEGAPGPQDYISSRICYLENADARIHFATLDREMNYFFRNADADEVFFVHTGEGRLQTDFGGIQYEPGDYIIIPRGTVYRWVPQKLTRHLIIETFSEIRLPDKGILGQHALFDPAILRCPTLTEKETGPSELKIQRCGQITTVQYPRCPLTTVGWKGTLSVWQLNVRDIRPVLSDRYHLPPSAHSTFIANNLAICTFLPRPLENGDPRAMKVPFYHSNIDFDEVLFYHAGEFFSRTGIHPGMMTFHPQGIHHGPQSQAVSRADGARATQEIAVMIDTKRPLTVTAASENRENRDYWKSWMKS